MGSITDARIAGWQKEAGIEPAIGERDEALEEISRQAYELIRLIELERSGIRDGDGSWHGSDPLDGTINDLAARWQRLPDSPGITPEACRARLEQAVQRCGMALGHTDPANEALALTVYRQGEDALASDAFEKMRIALAALDQFEHRHDDAADRIFEPNTILAAG